MNKKLRGFGFYRTSGDSEKGQNRGYGLSTQKRDVKDFCKANGIELVEEYTSIGVSGTEFEKDYQLQEMLENADKCDVIVSKSSCRLFGRDFPPFREVMVKRTLMKYGKKVFLTDTPDFDLYETDETKCFINGFMGLLDSYERMRISTKLSKSRRNRVMTGRRGSGNYPLVYMKDINKETIVNPKTKPIVEFLFSNYDPDLKEQTLSGLSRQVKAKFEIKLTPSGIRKNLTNKFYIGLIKHGDLPLQEGKHETFITKNRFGRVNKKIIRNIG